MISSVPAFLALLGSLMPSDQWAPIEDCLNDIGSQLSGLERGTSYSSSLDSLGQSADSQDTQSHEGPPEQNNLAVVPFQDLENLTVKQLLNRVVRLTSAEFSRLPIEDQQRQLDVRDICLAS